MQIIEDIAVIKKHTETLRSSGKQIGFVPTMGALHAGHLSLIQTAATKNDVVICSIFVNPTQFNNPEDYRLYPRLLEEDSKLLAAHNCDILFAPLATEIYTERSKINLSFGHLETVMEGKFRPGHFNGVATIVSKLFHLVKPHRAYFGQKDLQQFAIIKRLVTDLSFDLELICHPIIRENDGLAMSSRNRRLKPAERAEAINIYKALQLAEKSLSLKSAEQIREEVFKYLQGFKTIQPEYFELVDADSLQPITEIKEGTNLALCIAAFVGEVRLIDNIVVG